MTQKSKTILASLLGLATLATFFVPNTAVTSLFDPISLLRTVLALALLVAVLRLVPGAPKPDNNLGTKRYGKWVNGLVLSLPIIAVGFAVINVLNPELGSTLVHGSDSVQFRPAIFVKLAFDLASCVIFAVIAVRLVKRKTWLLVVIVTLLALVTFWMAMEEISWGQRIFKWETTGYFANNNMQGETNLHNLNTQLFQNVLYFGGFLLLVVLPFFRDQIAKLMNKTKQLKQFTWLLPGTWMIGAFAAGMGFTDPYISEAGWRWGSIFFGLLATAVILIAYVVRLRKQEDKRYSDIACTLAAFLVVLATSLIFPGVWYQNSGSPTEYVEMFIAFGITCWAIDLYLKSKTPNAVKG